MAVDQCIVNRFGSVAAARMMAVRAGVIAEAGAQPGKPGAKRPHIGAASGR
jgi:hypothetical protein